MTIRIAVAQTAPVLGRTEENLRRALERLAAERADVYVLPELAFSGYNFDTAEQVRALAEPADRGPVFDAVRRFAAERNAWVAYGFPESTAGGVYNSATLIGPAGPVAVYRKTHLFGREKLFFLPGDTGFRVHDLPFGRVGLMVCFDWFFPESVRTLALRGAQLVLHPANLVLPHCPEAMKTRCLENRVFAATADRIGTEPGGDRPLTYIGQSQVVSPRGEVLVRLGPDAEGVAAADVDLSLADDKSVTPTDDLFLSRRPDHYAR
jgi:predicted amidohydrolase